MKANNQTDPFTYLKTQPLSTNKIKISLKFPQNQNATYATLDIVVKPHFELHA